MKKLAIFLTLFLVLIYSATSLKTFEINETDRISLAPKVEDPDADRLAYAFTEPLNESGEWQTTYGDAGNYRAIVTVSDGVNEVSEDVIITVNRKEEKPTIDDAEPKGESIRINEGENIKFKIAASDLNNDKLLYEWNLDDEVVSNDKEILFDTGYEDAGDYLITATVSDGASQTARTWDVVVNDVDVSSVLGQIKDVTVAETETASLELPDFRAYGLDYEISEPLGNKNSWKTGYDDAGEYEVTIKAEGRGFEGGKKVKITITNKDRKPQFIGLKDMSINEDQQLNIELKAADADNDRIIFSAEDIPQGAELADNAFVWKPGYDFVQKENALGYVLDKFRLLSKSVDVKFIAQGGSLKDEKSIKITVKDSNRPFILEEIEDVEINEGEEIVIEPKYNDPDLDKVSFSYSGFMNGNKKVTGFDDAGQYIVKIAASDGYFEETRFVNVKVNDVNIKPVFSMEDSFEAIEGEELRIELNAVDRDNDAVKYFAAELPEGAELRDNLFVWKPGFDFVNGTKKEMTVEFIASDDKNESAVKKVKIDVLNKNKGPEIISASDNLIVNKDEPALFEIIAEDIDGDELTYNWDFGFLDKFEGTNTHQRVFTTTGSKEVKVTVSDGMESTTKVWKVEVV